MATEDAVIVIPAHMEEDKIAEVVKESLEYGYVVVVDDGSGDATAEKARSAGAKVLKQPVNMGVGFATRTGVEYAIRRLKPDFIVTIDGDGQHDPSHIPQLLGGLRDGADLVFTNRLSEIHKMPLSKRLGNMLLSFTTNTLAGSSVTDTQSGFRAFKAGVYPLIKWMSDDYSFCSEIVYNAGKNNVEYSQVDIPAVYHDERGYKGTTIQTGIVIFLKTILFRLRR